MQTHTCTHINICHVHTDTCLTHKYAFIFTALKMKEVTVFSPDQLTRENMSQTGESQPFLKIPWGLQITGDGFSKDESQGHWESH